ncbi:TPA: hypothetical protein EYN98_18225 [Candidatus Poribacteria bacterium]|nr:hypothetical protein [Candidatus Poribacteria bacterium]HIA67945.1 hypothetical protein [Candidatus Poribacteria bacterium]HIB90157.1 hypothetical protein [Candidatus Poribacteria bacterium]HIC00336.1 hypothetical protein [Candidatus Poribacteria bacterium]HIN29631.1 hypothetical protein [Candidatus Poribacteria bacterium]
MTAEKIFERIHIAINTIIRTGQSCKGLFPSILDPQTGEMLLTKPPKIPGQRDGDRAHLGSNLIHDEPLLQTMYALGEPQYAEAADRYLCHFSLNCTDTLTGLFPWGEHSFWHVIEERVGCSRNSQGGNAIHDHLRQVPLWLWEKLNSFNPGCVQNFADGLDYHWTEGPGYEYIRHANIDILSRLVRGDRSCDFPRHSGFYIFDLTFAYVQHQRSEIFDQICLMTDYWWERRDGLGLLLIESRSPQKAERFFGNNAPTQTLSLGASLLESADLMEPLEAELASKMRDYAKEYITAFLSAPHQLAERKFVSLCQQETQKVVELMSIWGSVYGVGTACGIAVLCINIWRLTQNQELLNWAQSVGQSYLDEQLPVDQIVVEEAKIPAADPGLVLGLFSDLYDVTGESNWLEAGLDLAADVCDVYFQGLLPLGASGISWYESQLGSAFLIHGLARLAFLAQGNCPLAPNYTAR